MRTGEESIGGLIPPVHLIHRRLCHIQRERRFLRSLMRLAIQGEDLRRSDGDPGLPSLKLAGLPPAATSPSGPGVAP